jgi:hypothetical protein
MTGKKRDRKLRIVPPGKGQLRTVTNGHGTKINKAIDRAQARERQTQPAPPPSPDNTTNLALVVHNDPLRLSVEPPKGVSIRSPRKAETTVVLILEGDAWRAVLLPPGTTWQLRPAPPGGAKPAIWTPGKQR